MYNIKVELAYNGKLFKGFQKQVDVRTVSFELERILNQIYKMPVSFSFSGRTDSGVHAAHQVINYLTEQYIPEKGLLKALRAYSVEDIQIKGVSYVLPSFHSRYSARSREYRYRVSESEIPLSMTNFMEKVGFSIDLNKTAFLTGFLPGEHDFRHFRALGSQEPSTCRCIYFFDIKKCEILDLVNLAPHGYYEVTIVGNSFLYKMVRNLVGAIFELWRGRIDEQCFKQMFQSTEPSFQYQTVSAKGLSLTKVNY